MAEELGYPNWLEKNEYKIENENEISKEEKRKRIYLRHKEAIE